MDIIAAFNRLAAPLQRRVDLMIGRAIVRLVDDSGTRQTAQIEGLGNQTLDFFERFQQYGLTSVPHPGAEAIALRVRGNSSHTIVISIEDRRYRLVGLANGEVALYDDLGQRVHLTRTGIVLDTPLNVTISAGQKARIKATDIELSATHSLKWDVNGFGRRITSTGGTAYQDRTWQQGATVSAVTGPINPPEGP